MPETNEYTRRFDYNGDKVMIKIQHDKDYTHHDYMCIIQRFKEVIYKDLLDSAVGTHKIDKNMV